MPVQHSPDLFFLSGGDYNKFLQWIQDTRTALVSLNRFNPLNEGAIINVDAVKNFAQTAILSYNFKTSSQFETSKQDITVSKINKQAGDISDAVQQYSKDQLALLDTQLKDEQDGNANFTADDNIVRQQQIIAEIRHRNPSEFDKNNPIPAVDRIDTTSNAQAGYSKSYLDSTHVVVTPRFPQLGKEYNNHMADITDRLNNITKFEVFTGYRSKNDPSFSGVLGTEFRSWALVKGTDKSQWEPDPSATFTPDRQYSDYVNEVLKKTEAAKYPGSYKFFIEKLHGRYSDLTPYKMNKIKSQKTVLGEQNLSNRMVFSAYIDNYNDGYSLSWSDYNFIGRAEAVPIYKSTKRNMTLEFTLLADYSAEYMVAMEKFDEQLKKNKNQKKEDLLQKLIKEAGPDWGIGEIRPPVIYDDERVGSHVPGMYSDTPEGLWSKMTFLSQCCYPFYREDGKMKEQPIIRVRIADFYDVILCINSMNFQMNQFDGPMVDMNPSSLGNMPFGLKVTLDGSIIHNYEPSSEFYGFYNRKEYDEGTKDPITGIGINLHENKMQQGATKNSPVDFNSTFNNEKLLNINNAGNSIGELNKNLNVFTKNFGDLKNAGVRLKDNFIKNKTQKSIEAFQAVNSAVNHLRILNGLQPTSSDANLKNIAAITSGGNADNLGTSSLSVFNQVVDDAKNFKQSFDQTYGAVQNTIQSVTSTLSTINNDLKKVGINIMNNDAIDKVVKQANSVLPQQVIPKTIGDILNHVRGNGIIN